MNNQKEMDEYLRRMVDDMAQYEDEEILRMMNAAVKRCKHGAYSGECHENERIVGFVHDE